MGNTSKQLISKSELSERWGTSPRTIDRMRVNGILPWIDLSAGLGKKPIVRFKLEDIEHYENKFRMDPLNTTTIITQ